jgi:hypothetical protein
MLLIRSIVEAARGLDNAKFTPSWGETCGWKLCGPFAFTF